MSSGKKVFNNTLILYVKMFITVIPSLYATRLLLESLGDKDFGILNLIIGILSMLNFFNAGLSSSSLRFMSYAKGKNDFTEELKIFNISTFLHLSLAIILSLIFFSFSSIFIDKTLNIELDRVESAKILFNCLIIGMFFTIVSVPYDALINAHENMFMVAIISIIESLLKLSGAIYISIYADNKLETYGYILAIISFIIYINKLLYCHINYSETKFNFRKNFDKELFKEIFSFSSYNSLGISFQMVSFYGQSIILNVFFGTIVNAAQGIVNQISGQLSSFAQTMQKALNPMIVKNEGAGKRQQMIEASLVGTRLSFFMLMFFYIPVLIELESILNLWLVNVPQYTLVFAQLYFIRNLIDQLYLTLGLSIMSVGKIKRFQIYNSILSILPLPIAYFIFTLKYPAEYIYIIFIIYSIIQGLIYIIFAKIECNMSIKLYFKSVIIKSILSFILVFLVVLIPHFYIDNEIYRIILVFGVNLCMFALVMWYIGLLDKEKRFLTNLLIRKKNGNNI